jgi:hypothetical protein
MIDYLGWRDAAELLLLPPANLIVLMIAAAFVWPRRPGAAAAMWGIAVAFLYLFSLPVFANSAISLLEPPPLDPAS